jgi:hypothetical protein
MLLDSPLVNHHPSILFQLMLICAVEILFQQKKITCDLKKLHNPMNCLTSCMFLGGSLFRTALSLSAPGKIPSGVGL